MNRLSYAQARKLILLAGLVVLLVVAVVMYARRVDPVEVAATLLFIPIFLAFVFGGIPGGVLMALVATGVYVFLRLPAIDAVGADRFTGLIFSRGLAFFVFGAIGGWANQQLASSLQKLELHDQIDDATGLFNARFLVQDIDLETSRSDRYKTIFSISIVDVPAKLLGDTGSRKGRKLLKDVGDVLKNSVRTVDRVVHARMGDSHRFALVLPETGEEGARILTGRLAEQVGAYLSQRGAEDTGNLPHRSLTYPMQAGDVQRLRSEFSEIARSEFPETPTDEVPRGGPEARRASG